MDIEMGDEWELDNTQITIYQAWSGPTAVRKFSEKRSKITSGLDKTINSTDIVANIDQTCVPKTIVVKL